MLSVYEAAGAFAVVAALVPLLMLLASALIRHRSEGNPVKYANYECAEASIGTGTSIIEEYFHYFALFMGFEVAGIMMLLFASSARSVGLLYGIYMVLVAVLALAFATVGLLIAHRGYHGK